MSDDDTSIRIKIDTWQRLKERKDRPDKTHDDVISELLDAVEEMEGHEADEGNPNSPAALGD